MSEVEGEYSYDRLLGAEEVLVCLIDNHRVYPDLAREIHQAAARYGFTFREGAEALTTLCKTEFRIRHLIICDGENHPEAATTAHQDLVDLATSATIAVRYTDRDAFDHAAPVVEALKILGRNKVNYLRPTPHDRGFTPTKQKLIDNAICDSVRIKYRPEHLGAFNDTIPTEVLEYFCQASKLIETKELYHRAPTDGFISVRSLNGQGFFITCTKTNKIELDVQRIALVESYDRLSNTIFYRGSFLPSSDCVEAAIIYERLPNLTAILHTHASVQYTRNLAFRDKIAVPPTTYGEASLGDRIADFVLAQNCLDFVIMEDHGEMFFGWDNTPTACLYRISEVIQGDRSVPSADRLHG